MSFFTRKSSIQVSFLLLILVISPFLLFGQSTGVSPTSLSIKFQIDSLFNTVKLASSDAELRYAETREDSATIDQIDELLKKAMKVPTDSALLLAQQATQVALSANLPHSVAHTLYIQAWALSRMGEMQAAKANLFATIPVYEAYKDSQYLANNYNNLGLIYRQISQWDSALHFYSLSLAIREQQKDTVKIIGSLNNMSNTLTKQNKWQEALQYAISAYKLSERVPNYPRQGMILNSIGIIMGEIGDHKEAVRYHQKAFKVNQKYENLSGIVISLANIGEAYSDINELDSAVAVLKTALIEAEKIKNPSYISAICIMLGDLCLTQQLPQQSIPYFERAWGIAYSSGDLEQQFLIQQRRAEAYLALKSYPESYHFGLKAKGLAIQIGDKLQMHELHQLLAQVAHNLGKDGEAYAYLQSYTQFHDSVSLADLTERIKSVEAAFKDSLKTQEITVLTQENEISQLKLRRRSLIIWGLIGITVLILIALSLFFRQNRKIQSINQQLNEKQAALVALDRDKNHLVRLLTHDLRAPLGYIQNVLHYLSLQKLPDKFIELLKDVNKSAAHIYTLSKEISQTSQVVPTGTQHVIYQHDLIELTEHLEPIINKYAPLAAEKDVEVVLSITPEDLIIQSNELFLAHILGNLIQNAIKFSPYGEAVRVNGRIDEVADQFVIEVKDNGAGIPEKLEPYVFSNKKPPEYEGDGSEGLFLSQHLAKAIQAEISYETEPGQGSIFRLVGKR